MSGAPKAVDEVTVYRGANPIGQLKRTPRGASFSYAADVVANPNETLFVASTMPIRKAPYGVQGINLHPFFAGLLPEGLRHRALVTALKTSADDLFSLLLGAGDETVGDVWLGKPTQAKPIDSTPVAPHGELDFTALLERALGAHHKRDPKVIAGVQPKVSDAMLSLPVHDRTRGREWMLKLTPSSHPQLVENEAFFMQLARTAGLSVANCRVLHDKHGRAALLVERFDRSDAVPKDAPLAERAPHFLHQEDACQLLDRYPADKYRLSLREVADAFELCSAPVVERLRLLRLYAFSYAIANGDLHGKNISVLWAPGRIALSPAYDMLSTLPYGDDTMALKIAGRDKRIRRADLVAFGQVIGIKAMATLNMLDKLVAKLGPATAQLEEIGLPSKQTAHLARVIKARLAHLSGD